jgi:hypothetical protein
MSATSLVQARLIAIHFIEANAFAGFKDFYDIKNGI